MDYRGNNRLHLILDLMLYARQLFYGVHNRHEELQIIICELLSSSKEKVANIEQSNQPNPDVDVEKEIEQFKVMKPPTYTLPIEFEPSTNSNNIPTQSECAANIGKY
jgi:hypothetical protein